MPELDGLRGIAALSVCIFHFSLFKYGVTGVDLFFIISGFVIYMSLENAKTIGEFWKSRVIRLYPVYWFSIIVAVFCSIWILPAVHYNLRFILGNFTMMQPIFRCGNLVGVYWTLYVELTFYGLMTLIMVFKKLNKIENIILLLLAITLSLNITYLYAAVSHPGYARFFIALRGLIPLISHFHMFAAGIVFYLVKTGGYSAKRLFILVMSLLLVPVTHSMGGTVFYYLSATEHIVCCVLFFAIFVLFIHNNARALKWKVLVFLGDISFALYLIHASLGAAVNLYLSRYLHPFGAQLAGIAVSIFAAWLITDYYDKPVRSFLKKAFKKTRRQQVAEASEAC